MPMPICGKRETTSPVSLNMANENTAIITFSIEPPDEPPTDDRPGRKFTGTCEFHIMYNPTTDREEVTIFLDDLKDV